MQVNMEEKEPKYWEETVLPWIADLKSKQEEARKLMAELEAVVYEKAGYLKVNGKYIPKTPRCGVIMSSELGDNWTARHHLLKKR